MQSIRPDPVARLARSRPGLGEERHGDDNDVPRDWYDVQHCVRAVTGELARLSGVSSVEADLVMGGESLLTVVSDAPLTEQVVNAALDEAGDYHLAAH